MAATSEEAIQEVYGEIDVALHSYKTKNEASSIPINAIGTGFTDFDMLTAGFQNSELIVIASRPGAGKTAFAVNIVRHVVSEQSKPVLFVSLEQTRAELAQRLLCCQSHVDSLRMRRKQFSSEDMDRLLAAGEQLRTAPIFFDDSHAQSVLSICATARHMKQQHNIKLLVIDPLHQIDSGYRRSSRPEHAALILRRLKGLARELQIPVILLAQANYSQERTRLGDIKDGASIEQDADTIIILNRPEFHGHGQKDPFEIIVAKQRNGPTGEVSLIFVEQFMRFQNYGYEHPRL